MEKEQLENKFKRIVSGEHTPEEKESIEAIRKIDLAKNWERLQSSKGSGSDKRLSLKPNTRIYFTRIAAAILVLILSSLAIYTIRQKTDYDIRQVSSVTENTEVILADGSMIMLNQGSILSYPEKLNRRKREVHLAGEAWFEISKAKNSPFYVCLNNTSVKVLGTSFNIKEADNGKVIVNVVSGTVSFYENNNKQNAVILVAGQQGIFDEFTKEIGLNTFISENFLFWKTGKLSFRNELLEDVFQELEKNFNTNISVVDKKILNYRLTTHCEGQALNDIMNELSLLFDLNYYSQSDTIYVE